MFVVVVVDPPLLLTLLLLLTLVFPEEEDEDGFHVTDDLEGQRAKGSDAHVLRNIHPDGQQTRRGEKGDGFTRPVILGDEAPGEQLIQERPDGEHGERHERRRLS